MRGTQAATKNWARIQDQLAPAAHRPEVALEMNLPSPKAENSLVGWRGAECNTEIVQLVALVCLFGNQPQEGRWVPGMGSS